MKKILYILVFFSFSIIKAQDISIAIELYNEGKYKQAEEELLSMPETDKVLNALGRVNEVQGNFKNAINYYQRALKLANDTMEAVIRVNYGISLYELGQIDYAIEEYEASLEIAKRIKRHSTIEGCIQNLGTCYYQLRQYEKALEYFNEALKLTSDDYTIQQIYNNIALVYEEYDNYHDALDYYLKSLEICRHLDIEHEIAIAYSNVGTSYLALDDIEKARIYLDSSSYLNSNSFQYSHLSKYLDKVKVKEYEQTIQMHYMIATIIGLSLVLTIISVLVYKLNYKLKWNRKQLQIIEEKLANL
jgi:tetratricopeptide (TPR) repeat protein